MSAHAGGGRRRGRRWWKRRHHGGRGGRLQEEGEATGRRMASGVREPEVLSEEHVIASRMTSDPV